ncbi:MAG TPA: terminase family protein, partial [Nannocystis sp.]
MQTPDQGRMLKAAKRLLKARKAGKHLIDFTEFTMPSLVDPEDSDLSRYDAQYFHRALGATLEEVAEGRIKRLIITFPPRHGKSELTSKRFLAWLAGRFPDKSWIFGTYNQDFADDFGRSVRGIMQHPAYGQVFPGVELRKGSAAADRLGIENGGDLVFVGRGGSVTGRGGHGIVIDDPLKNSEEADSAGTREGLWAWLLNDIFSRLMDDTGFIILIMTRWHEDDPVGRLTDPTNPCYNAEEAAQWQVFNIPAIAEDNDVLLRSPGEPLWPSRFGLDYLLAFKRRNPRGFNSLYQQRPTPEDGELFKAEHIQTYLPHERPPLGELTIYGMSDHAVALKQENDRTCLLIVGVDQHENIYLLDCWWKRAPTDVVVEAMIDLIERWGPCKWWADNDHIKKSIGPFLKKRMRERKIYCPIYEQTAYADKVKKAQPIIARMSMGMIYFPAQAHWFQDA